MAVDHKLLEVAWEIVGASSKIAEMEPRQIAQEVQHCMLILDGEETYEADEEEEE